MGKRERQREKKRKAQIQSRRGRAFPPRPNRAEATGEGGDDRKGARGASTDLLLPLRL